MGLLLYGCVSFDVDIGESTQVSGLSNTQFEDEGEKNLAAIRAMLIEEHQRVSVAPDSDNKRSPEPGGTSVAARLASVVFRAAALVLE